jgi:hypothetical protein
MVRMLGFSEEDKQRIGLAQNNAGKGVVRGVLGIPGCLVGGIVGGSSPGKSTQASQDSQVGSICSSTLLFYNPVLFTSKFINSFHYIKTCWLILVPSLVHCMQSFADLWVSAEGGKKGRNKKGRKEKRQKLLGGHRNREKQPQVAVIPRVCNNHSFQQTCHLALQQGRICSDVQSPISRPFRLHGQHTHASRLHSQNHLQDYLSQNVGCTESILFFPRLFTSFVDNVMMIVDSKLPPAILSFVGCKEFIM